MKTKSPSHGTPAKAVKAVKVAAAKKIAPKPTRRWRAWAFQTYLVVALAGFTILFVLASMFNYLPADLRIERAVQTIHVTWFASLMWWISYIGYGPQIVILAAAVFVILFLIGLRWEAVTTLVALAGSSGLAQLIKIIVHRPRPGANLVTVLEQLNSYSFPSGHVQTYTAYFGFLFFLSFTLLKPSLARTILLAILGSLVALIGISRVYVGDHWPSDVIAAYLLGSLWLVLSVYLYRWGKKRFFVKQPLVAEEPGPVAPKS